MAGTQAGAAKRRAAQQAAGAGLEASASRPDPRDSELASTGHDLGQVLPTGVGIVDPNRVQDDTLTMESWEITTEGRVWLQVTSFTRHGQPIDKDVSLGPRKIGQKLKISVADRERNQENVSNPAHDPFLNGLLVRTDADQNTVAATTSVDALSTADLLVIYELRGEEFRQALVGLGQVPIRRLREMAEAVDATSTQINALEDVIDGFRNARSQADAVYDLTGQRRPEREGQEAAN